MFPFSLQSPKAAQLKAIVAERFRANKHVTDPAQLHVLKQRFVLRDRKLFVALLLCSPLILFFLRSLVCSAERGLSNYLLFERAKLDPKIAAAAADLDKFEDDESGNLVRVVKSGASPTAATSPAAKAAAEAAVTAQAAAKKARAVKITPGGISGAASSASKGSKAKGPE